MKKQEETTRQWQEEKKREARKKIMGILLNGKPHRYGEIIGKTKLSKATLSKHLKEMEKEGKITKHIDVESGKYPYPVYYELSEQEDALAKVYQMINKQVERFKSDLSVTKEPKRYLALMNKYRNLALSGILKMVREKQADLSKRDYTDQDVAEGREMLNLFIDLVLLEPFKRQVYGFLQIVSEQNIAFIQN